MNTKRQNLTENEIKVLRAILKSEYMDGTDHPVGHIVWSFSCNPFADKKTFPGVCASLSKKGLVGFENCGGGIRGGENVMWITQDGMDVLNEIDAKTKAEQPAECKEKMKETSSTEFGRLAIYARSCRDSDPKMGDIWDLLSEALTARDLYQAGVLNDILMHAATSRRDAKTLHIKIMENKEKLINEIRG
jgi:hypothetical protein